MLISAVFLGAVAAAHPVHHTRELYYSSEHYYIGNNVTFTSKLLDGTDYTLNGGSYVNLGDFVFLNYFA
jgi:hypothetical protein